MKAGYGFNRAEVALTDLGAERLYIDTNKTLRAERAALFQDLRPGDEVLVVAMSDLGRGPEVKKMRDAIYRAGATLYVPDTPTPREKPGRPRKFDPSPEQDRKIEALYRDYFTMAHVLHRASEIMGHDVKRHQLVHRYGNRWPDDKEQKDG